MNTQLQKILYGSVFCIVLPILLGGWIYSLTPFITLPVKNIPILSGSMILLGILLISGAMLNLWKRGKGLPMNAFPPEHYVQSGFYRYFHHPIYVGAILLLSGLCWWFESAAGCWVVTPIFTLLTIVYVIGYEKEIITKVFPNQQHTTFFDLPENKNRPSKLSDRLKVYCWIYLPWFIFYEIFIITGTPSDSINTFLFIDDWIPFLPQTILIYIFAYLFCIVIPSILHHQDILTQFVQEMKVIMILSFLCYICLPFIAYYPLPSEQNNYMDLLVWDKSWDGVTACFPSFHAIWALMAARFFTYRFPSFKILFWGIAIAIIMSCLLTKNHSLVDIISGILVFFIGIRHKKIYRYILNICNKIGNSWYEWNWGKVRLINHGFYAGLSGFAGFIVMSLFLPQGLWIIYAIGFAGFIGAGLWAQFIEGSPSLLRPFGYYGSVLGIAVTVILIAIFSAIDIWTLLAISCLAAPLIQAIGRLRCLVQGCCHGKIKIFGQGLIFNHKKSRVNKISGLSGKSLYPTQLYSIACNVVIFFILLRMVSLQMPANFITGLYLIFNGAGRFVEESLRGEAQTPYFLKMRVYQWLALLSIVAGCVFTSLPYTALPDWEWQSISILHAILYGLIITAVYGMDFPQSNRRFSRLT